MGPHVLPSGEAAVIRVTVWGLRKLQKKGPSLFWNVARNRSVVACRRFGTTYRSCAVLHSRTATASATLSWKSASKSECVQADEVCLAADCVNTNTNTNQEGLLKDQTKVLICCLMLTLQRDICCWHSCLWPCQSVSQSVSYPRLQQPDHVEQNSYVQASH